MKQSKAIETKIEHITLKEVKKILKKHYQDVKILDKDIVNVLMKATTLELEILSFMIIFDEHIIEYIEDCLKKIKQALAKTEREARRNVIGSLTTNFTVSCDTHENQVDCNCFNMFLKEHLEEEYDNS